MNLVSLTVEQIFFVAVCHMAHISGFVNQIYQLQTLNYVPPASLEQCLTRIDTLDISASRQFERDVTARAEPELGLPRTELMGRELRGAIDCVDDRHVIEFKCVAALLPVHYIQLALYLYLFNCEEEAAAARTRLRATQTRLTGQFARFAAVSSVVPSVPVPTAAPPLRRPSGRLFNILTGELVEIQNDPDTLRDLVRQLLRFQNAGVRAVSVQRFVRAAQKMAEQIAAKAAAETAAPEPEKRRYNLRQRNKPPLPACEL